MMTVCVVVNFILVANVFYMQFFFFISAVCMTAVVLCIAKAEFMAATSSAIHIFKASTESSRVAKSIFSCTVLIVLKGSTFLTGVFINSFEYF